MTSLVDTHCHIQSIGQSDHGEAMTRELWSKAGDTSAADVLERAKQAGVNQVICVGCELEDSRLAVEFVRERAGCYASIGLHPHEAQHYAGEPAKLRDFASLVKRPKVVAMGECGLDFYYDHSPKAAQLEILAFQIELALQHDLPLIFHVREAFEDFWPLFDRYQGARGVLHSFTDSTANLQKALDRGLYIGVNGIATFTKNPDQLAMYRTIPLSKLLLETDAPFLTPHPYRGKVNEPKYAGTVADFLASLRGEDRDRLANTTTSNTHVLFGI